MRRLLMVLVVGVCAMGLAASASAGEVKLILATGGTAGTYYPYGGAMGL